MDGQPDRRSETRRRFLAPATLRQEAPMRILRCVIADLSPLGARLVGVGLSVGPGPLVLNARALGGPVACELVWSEGDTMAVRFLVPRIAPAPRLPRLMDPARAGCAGLGKARCGGGGLSRRPGARAAATAAPLRAR